MTGPPSLSVTNSRAPPVTYERGPALPVMVSDGGSRPTADSPRLGVHHSEFRAIIAL
jgi:hypothetical protein